MTHPPSPITSHSHIIAKVAQSSASSVLTLQNLLHIANLCLFSIFQLSKRQIALHSLGWVVGQLVGVAINFPSPNDSSFSFSSLLLLCGPNILLHQIFSSFSFSVIFLLCKKIFSFSNNVQLVSRHWSCWQRFGTSLGKDVLFKV